MSQAAELNIEQELKRREEEQRALQIKRDLEVLHKREEDVKTGRSRLIAPEEFWSNVRKAGF
ncbi:MAG: hypothetical protein FWD93_01955 [Coriobacteriia bacterium]|nr:hypothetical protein [Coriobacteriia bacterium]